MVILSGIRSMSPVAFAGTVALAVNGGSVIGLFVSTVKSPCGATNFIGVEVPPEVLMSNVTSVLTVAPTGETTGPCPMVNLTAASPPGATGAGISNVKSTSASTTVPGGHGTSHFIGTLTGP